MNVLSDFIVRVEAQYPAEIENEELNALITTIKNQASEIEILQKELKSAKLEKQQAKTKAETSKSKAKVTANKNTKATISSKTTTKV